MDKIPDLVQTLHALTVRNPYDGLDPGRYGRLRLDSSSINAAKSATLRAICFHNSFCFLGLRWGRRVSAAPIEIDLD